MKHFFPVVALAAILFSSLTATADDATWDHWRGPNKNGSVDNGQPPTEWSLEKNIKWKVEVPGKGSSTPIIHGNQVILLAAVKTDRVQEEVAADEPAPQVAQRESRGDGRSEDRPEGRPEGRSGRRGGGGGGRSPRPTNYYQFLVISYDRATGSKLWETVVTEQVPHEAGHGTNTFASSSPTTDGKNIFVNFGSRGVFCLDMQGNILWEKQLGQMQTVAGFGEGSSATIAGDKLIVPWDHQGNSYLIALDVKTGDEVWRTARDEDTTWATPLVVDYKDRTQVITNGKKVRSYDLADGKLIWECSGQVSNPIPSPILLGDKVICMTGYRGDAIQCISLDSQGDVSGSDKIVWSNNKAAPYVPSATLYDGYLYLNKGLNNIVTVIEAESGEIVAEQQRIDGLDQLYSSPVAVAGHIYFTGRDGTTIVVKHGKELEVVAKNPLGETIDSSLAIVGDTIFARGEKHLFCIAE